MRNVDRPVCSTAGDNALLVMMFLYFVTPTFVLTNYTFSSLLLHTNISNTGTRNVNGNTMGLISFSHILLSLYKAKHLNFR